MVDSELGALQGLRLVADSGAFHRAVAIRVLRLRSRGLAGASIGASLAHWASLGPVRVLLRAVASGVAALVVAAGAAVLPAAADTGLDWPEEPARTVDDQCAHILFVGARGSGEEWPYGPTIERVRDVLLRSTAETPGDRPRASVREIALDFPATSPYSLTDIGIEQLLFDDEIPDNDYLRSVADGRAELHWILDDSAERCPDERWVLVGFSQGAQVINETLAERGDSPQLAGVLLLGNPLHYPTQGGTEYGTADDSMIGLVAALHYLRETAQVGRASDDEIGLKAVIRTTLAMSDGDIAMPRLLRVAHEHRMELPESVADRVVSVCDDGDIICDAGNALARIMLGASTMTQETDQARPIHTGYSERIIAEASAALVEDLLANIPDEVPSTPEPTPEPEPEAEFPVELVGAGAGVGLAAAVGVGLLVRRLRRPSDEVELHDDDSVGNGR